MKLAARLDIYLRELQAALKQERGEEVCLQTNSSACRTLEQTRKKTLIAAEQDCPDVAQRRAQ